MKRIALTLSALMLASCSLVGLDDLPLTECSSNADCAGANVRYAAHVDACTQFQCVDRVCQLSPLDGDGDGFSPRACAEDVAMADCDDADPDRKPDNDELCDGRDNDCDGALDEGVIGATTFTAETHDVSASSGSRSLLAARGAFSGLEMWNTRFESLELIVPAFDGKMCPVPSVTGHVGTVPATTLCEPVDEGCQDGDPCNGLELCRLVDDELVPCELPPIDACDESAECLPNGCRELVAAVDETCAEEAMIAESAGEYVAAYLVTREGDDDPRGCDGRGLVFLAAGSPTRGMFEVLDGESDQGPAFMDGAGCVPRRSLALAGLPRSARPSALLGYVAETSTEDQVVLRAITKLASPRVSPTLIFSGASSVAIVGVRDLGWVVALGTADGVDVRFVSAWTDGVLAVMGEWNADVSSVNAVSIAAGSTSGGAFPVGVAYAANDEVSLVSLDYDGARFEEHARANVGTGSTPAIAFRDRVVEDDVIRGETVTDVRGYDVALARGSQVVLKRFSRHDTEFFDGEVILGEASSASAIDEGWVLHASSFGSRVDQCEVE